MSLSIVRTTCLAGVLVHGILKCHEGFDKRHGGLVNPGFGFKACIL
jgi:hypothetical protein